VSVNDVLGKPDGITIQDNYPNTHAGRAPDSDGGTLVYNPRNTTVAGTAETRGGSGPLHDPTAIIYVRTEDLVAKMPGGNGKGPNFVPDDPYCWRMEKKAKYDPSLPACSVRLADGVPIEPLVIRANAGECLNVTLRNKVLAQAHDDYGNLLFQADGKPAFEDKRAKGIKVYVDDDYDGYDIYDVEPAKAYFDETLDLASGNAISATVRRDPGVGAQGMTSFQSNLMQPSAHVGLHPQLLEYDVTRGDGTNVGQNPAQQSVAPGSLETYQWYAGHIAQSQAGRNADRIRWLQPDADRQDRAGSERPGRRRRDLSAGLDVDGRWRHQYRCFGISPCGTWLPCARLP